eukprot:TRINITY_DN7642_c0_g1_i2.p3 TRINITY_DN7642_c0_g1~~TRINITY_DN7642_c0_g1_i2.p3  ORF type:complete len:222 (+),score=99.06 TRINITY_DN7642_c0_g1_i2:93-668(+)
MTQFTKGKRLKKLTNSKRRKTQTRLERDLAEHLVQSRDRVELELARVRPVFAKKRKRLSESAADAEAAPAEAEQPPSGKRRRLLLLKERKRAQRAEKAAAAAPAESPAAAPAGAAAEAKPDPLNPLGESRNFRKKRTRGKDKTLGPGPPGPGVTARVKGIVKQHKEATGQTVPLQLLSRMAEKLRQRRALG